MGEYHGYGQIACLAISTACGLLFDYLSDKIMSSKKVQERLKNRIYVGIAFVAFFLLCELAARAYTGSSLMSTLAEQYLYVLILPCAGFILSLAISYLKVKRLEKKFGRGEKGLHADEKVKQYFESLSGSNHEITGEYDKNYAVSVQNGTFVGFRDGKIVKFLGIPYASANRFKPPIKAEESGKVYEAKYFGPSPIQPINDMNYAGWHNQGENCLTLNVFYKHSKNTTGAKAVIVMPMPGDYVSGSVVDPVADATELLKNHDDLIYVSFTYRVGVLGFTDLSGLPGGEDFPDSADLGILDALEALKWIKNNISSFGGDEDNITVMGLGIGGMIATILSSSEKAKGLFNKAFIVSNYGGLIRHKSAKREEAEMLMDYFGCKTASDLLNLSVEDIRCYTEDEKTIVTGPSYGTQMLPGSILDAYSSGTAKDIDMVFCQASGDFGEWVLTEGLEDTKKYIDIILNQIEIDARDEDIAFINSVLEENLAQGMNEMQAKRHLLECLLFRATTLAIADAQIGCGGKARLLYTDFTPDIELFGTSSVYVFCTFLGNKYTAERLGLILFNGTEKIAGQMLRNFVSEGDPSVKPNEVENVGAIPWPYFDGSDETVMSSTDKGFKTGKTHFVSETERFLSYVKV